MRWAGLMVLAVTLLVGCARGPDEATLQREVQEKLTKQVKDGLEVASFHRRGSAPMPAGEQGAKRLIVYYNATLRFRQDYDFGGWEKLSPASLGYTLGATEKGLFGVKPQNRAGDVLYVYGTSTYEWSNGAWKSVAATPAAGTAQASDPENTAPPSRSKQLIDRLAARVNLPPPGVDPREDEVISDELDRATRNIDRRLARRQHGYTFASGPQGGEYARFGAAFVESLKKVRPELSIRDVTTEGSVDNARLLARGGADYAIMQSDVAAEAVAGRGAFKQGGPLTTLRALGSLFPEPIHIVVPATSPIRAVEDLRGKRVNVGTPGSGTHHSAVAVLAAHGLKVGDLGAASGDGLDDATRRLAAGQLDALFMTIAAPARGLQKLAAGPGMRLLSLPGRTINRLVAEHPGVVALTLPSHTYPGQDEPVATVASTALLVSTTDAPDKEVENIVGFVFGQADLVASGSAEGVKVSKDSGLRGVTIPMHPGASRFFAKRS